MSMPRFELTSPQIAVAIASLTVALAAACGPTVYPSTRMSDMPTGAQTAESAGEGAGQEEKRPAEVVIYSSSGEAEQPPLPPATPDTPPDQQQPRAPGRAETPLPSERPSQTYVLERQDSRITVRHGPHEKKSLIGAFESAARALQTPSQLGAIENGDGPATRDWDPEWKPDRLQLDELAVVDESRLTIRGSAASEADIDEFLARLDSLESFSNVELASSQPTPEGQGVAFEITASYEADSPHGATPPPSE